MIRTQIYLTQKENDEIKKIIEYNGGGTKADIVRRAIDEYIDKRMKYTVISASSTPFRSPGAPSWSDPMPNPTHVGRKIRVIKGDRSGRSGIITSHWLNADDCSGNYGQQLYALDHQHDNNNSYGINVKECEFID